VRIELTASFTDDISQKFLHSFLWLMYLNPSFYGYTGMLRLVLPELQTGCEYQSAIECYPDTGEFWMSDFGMDEVQPTLNLLVRLHLQSYVQWTHVHEAVSFIL
jgi:hypothetical protein